MCLITRDPLETYLFNDFSSICRLHNLDGRLVPEFCHNHVVKGVEVDAFMAFFNSSDVVNLVKIIDSFLSDAEDAC